MFAVLGCDGLAYDLDSVSLHDAERLDVSDAGEIEADTDVDAEVADMSKTSDMTPSDADRPDAADLADVADTGPGRQCATPFPLADDAPCNPTLTGECPQDGICTLAVVTVPPPELACLPREQEGDAGDGEACGRPSDCAENLACVDWSLNESDPRGKVCTKYCELETGVGCDVGEFCTKAEAQPPVDGIGWCTPTCDPYDPQACPAGQTCSIDYNYPSATCLPNFRCVEVTDFQMEGDGCGPGAETTRCVRGLTCYEVDIALFQCVRPCQDDSDCDAGDCGGPAGDWDLKFCR